MFRPVDASSIQKTTAQRYLRRYDRAPKKLTQLPLVETAHLLHVVCRLLLSLIAKLRNLERSEEMKEERRR